MRRGDGVSGWQGLWLAAAAALLMPASSAEERQRPAATEALERAAGRDPGNAALQYNLGTRHYQQGDYDKAASALSQAVGFARGRFEGRAAYNLGNARYRQGQAAEATAPDQAGRLYSEALEHYRTALRRDPRDEDARFNYELVERRLQELQIEQESQAQAQQQASEDGERQDAEQQAGGQAQQSQAQSQESAELSQQQAVERQPGQREEGQAEEASQEAIASGEQQTPPRDRASEAEPAEQDRELSQQEMLWILDSVKQEEQAALMDRLRQPAQDPAVDRDW